MKINQKKINILENEWLDKEYSNSISSQFHNAQIPVFKSQVLSLLELNNDSYWGGLRSVHKIDLAMLDHRHWHYDDSVFAKYVERVVSVQFPAICLFDNPMGYEMPRVNPNVFSEKLGKRTEILANAIRRRHKNTIILSPSIDVLDANLTSLYVDYFIRNRQHFDIYSVHCCNSMDEHSLGKLTNLLSQVMKVAPKKLWITKWAVPSFEGKLEGSRFLGPQSWTPDNYIVAGQRFRRSFNLIETAATLGSQWFYTGIGMDSYNPRIIPGENEYWKESPWNHSSGTYTPHWNFWHFLGLVTHDKKIKTPIIKMLLNLASKQNSSINSRN